MGIECGDAAFVHPCNPIADEAVRPDKKRAAEREAGTGRIEVRSGFDRNEATPAVLERIGWRMRPEEQMVMPGGKADAIGEAIARGRPG